MYFFFQAEDGIRDFHVTGVQTCALPILGGAGAPRSVDHDAGAVLRQLLVLHRAAAVAVLGIPVVALVAAVVLVALVAVAEIGRASCRERGCVAGPSALLKPKEKTRSPT